MSNADVSHLEITIDEAVSFLEDTEDIECCPSADLMYPEIFAYRCLCKQVVASVSRVLRTG